MARRSAEENAARGNPGKRAKPVASVTVLPVMGVKPPRSISKAGKKWWGLIAAPLIQLKIMRATDAPAFMILCESFGRYEKVRDELEIAGYWYKAATVAGGEMRRIDPRYLVLDRERRTILNFAESFGMTPAARAKVLATIAGGLSMLTPNEPRAPEPDDVAQLDLSAEGARPLPQPRTVGGYKDVTDA